MLQGVLLSINSSSDPFGYLAGSLQTKLSGTGGTYTSLIMQDIYYTFLRIGIVGCFLSIVASIVVIVWSGKSDKIAASKTNILNKLLLIFIICFAIGGMNLLLSICNEMFHIKTFP